MLIKHLLHADEVTSSNDLIRAYPVHTAIVVNSQTAGRGRQGHAWHSPLGGLYCSLKLPVLQSFQTGLAAVLLAIALHRSLESYSPSRRIFLKWPNDLVYSASEKLAGILLERGADYVIAGIGLNLYLPAPRERVQEGERIPVALFSEQRAWQDFERGGGRSMLLLACFSALEQLLNQDLEEVLSYWHAHHIWQRGDALMSSEGSGAQIWHFDCMGRDGQLWLSDENGHRQSFTASEISKLQACPQVLK